MHHMAPFFFRVGEIYKFNSECFFFFFLLTIQDTTVHYYVLPSFPFFLHTAGGVMRGIFPLSFGENLKASLKIDHFGALLLTFFFRNCNWKFSNFVHLFNEIFPKWYIPWSHFCSVGEILQLYCFPSCIVKKNKK